MLCAADVYRGSYLDFGGTGITIIFDALDGVRYVQLLLHIITLLRAKHQPKLSRNPGLLQQQRSSQNKRSRPVSHSVGRSAKLRRLAPPTVGVPSSKIAPTTSSRRELRRPISTSDFNPHQPPSKCRPTVSPTGAASRKSAQSCLLRHIGILACRERHGEQLFDVAPTIAQKRNTARQNPINVAINTHTLPHSRNCQAQSR